MASSLCILKSIWECLHRNTLQLTFANPVEGLCSPLVSDFLVVSDRGVIKPLGVSQNDIQRSHTALPRLLEQVTSLFCSLLIKIQCQQCEHLCLGWRRADI